MKLLLRWEDIKADHLDVPASMSKHSLQCRHSDCDFLFCLIVPRATKLYSLDCILDPLGTVYSSIKEYTRRS